MIKAVKQTMQGIAVLKEWLGSGGKSVSEFDSERRALICEICPRNVEPNWFSKMVAGPVAERIKRHLEAKNKLGLSTSVDDELHFCNVCSCVLKLKVHTPLEHIINHTSKEQLESFPPNCWIPIELKEKGISL